LSHRGLIAILLQGVNMSDFVTTIPDGVQLPIDSVAQTIAYSGNFVNTITVAYSGNTYVQTFTNDGTNITAISGWVKQ
jgi:hypothetical protein